MLKEVRKIKSAKKQHATRYAIYSGRIKGYVLNGHMAYDTDEYDAYKATATRGRPLGSKNKPKADK